MLYREIIAVCSQIHTKHTNALCGQNVELLNVKLAVHIVPTGLEGLIYMTRKFIPYRAVNTSSCLKKQSVNAVNGNNRCLFSDPHKTANKLCGQNVKILGALEVLRKPTINFVMCVCLSVSAPTGRVFVKFDIRAFFENLSMKFKFL
jgi:hypothetical protein